MRNGRNTLKPALPPYFYFGPLKKPEFEKQRDRIEIKD